MSPTIHARCLRRLLPLVLIALTAGAAAAFQTVDQNVALEIPLPRIEADAPGGLAAQLAARQIENQLLERYGLNWRVQGWNRLSDSPHLAYGRSFPATATLDDAADLEQAARRVMGENPELFGAPLSDLTLAAAPQARGKWVAHFQQTHHGLPIWEARPRLGFAEDGRLMFMSSDLFSRLDLDPNPALDAAAAEALATNALPFDPSTDRLDGESELMVLPIAREHGGAEHHLVWRVRVHTEEPLGTWVSHVDAHDGEILWRYNDIHFAYGGDTDSDTQPITWCDGSAPEVMPHLNVDISGPGTVTSDVAGDWSVDGRAGPLTASCVLQRPYIPVADNLAGAEAFV